MYNSYNLKKSKYIHWKSKIKIIIIKWTLHDSKLWTDGSKLELKPPIQGSERNHVTYFTGRFPFLHFGTEVAGSDSDFQWNQTWTPSNYSKDVIYTKKLNAVDPTNMILMEFKSKTFRHRNTQSTGIYFEVYFSTTKTT